MAALLGGWDFMGFSTGCVFSQNEIFLQLAANKPEFQAWNEMMMVKIRLMHFAH